MVFTGMAALTSEIFSSYPFIDEPFKQKVGAMACFEQLVS
jgi:hypothetical protein